MSSEHNLRKRLHLSDALTNEKVAAQLNQDEEEDSDEYEDDEQNCERVALAAASGRRRRFP